jgi:hypothetical protein
MTTAIESIDGATSRILVGGVEAFRFTAAGVEKVKDGTVTAAKLASDAKPVGVGQTWQNVVASRSSGTVFTNSTGRTIAVSASAVSAANTPLSLTGNVDALQLGYQYIAPYAGGSTSTCVFFLVPPGSTYHVDVSGHNSLAWTELR